jgi:hypothetical protein
VFYILLSIDPNLFHQGRMVVQFYLVIIRTHRRQKRRKRLVFPFLFRSKPTPLGADVIFSMVRLSSIASTQH